jgi:hypothetical protein
MADMEAAMLGAGHKDLETVRDYISMTADKRVRAGVGKLTSFVADMQKMKFFTTPELIAGADAFKKIKMPALVQQKNVDFMRVTLAVYNEAVEVIKQQHLVAVTRQGKAATKHAAEVAKKHDAAMKKKEKAALKVVKSAKATAKRLLREGRNDLLEKAKQLKKKQKVNSASASSSSSS